MPSQTTLDKYGLTAAEYQTLKNSHGGACWICGSVPTSGRLNVDHAHVKGWSKMLPGDRKKHVRGLLCFVCNHRMLTRGVTIERLSRAIDYLIAHDKRAV
ncbi:MAG: endonuclease domain-containing protein [Chloroflexota bacterium]